MDGLMPPRDCDPGKEPLREPGSGVLKTCRSHDKNPRVRRLLFVKLCCRKGREYGSGAETSESV